MRLCAILSAILSALLSALVLPAGVGAAQEIPEYEVKAVYLFNFVKFVRWPSPAASAPIAICVAERNPFGETLNEALSGEVVERRRLAARVIRKPEPGCDVVFVPVGVGAKPYLQAARGSSTLTVGEERGFLGQGGIINFLIENGNVRFEINAVAAERAGLQVSSHLLRLARGAGRGAAR